MNYEFKDYSFNPLLIMAEIDGLFKHKETFKHIVNVPIEDLMYILNCIKNGVASYTSKGSILTFKCDATKSKITRIIKCYSTMLDFNYHVFEASMHDEDFITFTRYSTALKALEYIVRYSKTLI